MGIPGKSTGNMATESEFGSKIDKAIKARMKGYEDMVIQKGYMVFHQTNNEKAWLGPVEVTNVDTNYIFVKTNGERRKVPKCNVKLNVKNGDCDDEILEAEDKEEEKD